jgi:Immunoglobulin domain
MRKSLFIPLGYLVFAFLFLDNASAQSFFQFDARGNLTNVASLSPAPPTIALPPTNQEVYPGQDAAFSVIVGSAGPISYQWYRNGLPISVGTNATLFLPSVTLSSQGSYTVVICNPYGCVTSGVPALLEFNKTWIASGPGDWYDPSNWYPAGVPTGNVDIVINSGTIEPSAPVTILGTLTWSGGTIEGDVTVANGATMNWYANGELPEFNGNLTNEGTINWYGVGEFSGTPPLYNESGVLNVFGQLTWTGTGTEQGVFNIPSGGILDLDNGTVGIDFQSGSTISGEGILMASAGPVNFTGSAAVSVSNLYISGATVNFNGTGAVTIGYINLSAGTLAGSQAIVDSGPLDWSGGTISGTVSCNGGTWNASVGGLGLPGGQLTIVSGSTVNCSATSLGTGFGSVLNNNGTLNITANLSEGGRFGPGTLNNSGTFSASGSVSLGDTFNNTGAVTLSGGPVNQFGTFNNTGTVTVNSGTLNLSGGGVESGPFNMAAGTTFELGDGTFTFNTGATITGSGSFLGGGGIADLGNNLQLAGEGTFSVNEGNISVEGNLALGGPWTFGNGTTTLNCSTTVSGNVVNISGGTVYFSGSGPWAPASLNVSFGVLEGTSPIQDSGPLNWSGGNIGNTVTCNGGTWSGSSGLALYGDTLNGGNLTIVKGSTVNCSASQLGTGFGSVLNNNGTLNLTANLAEGGRFGPGTFNNSGTFTASASVNVGDTFNNTGTVFINSGTLSLTGTTSLTNGTLGFGIDNLTNFGQLSLPGHATLGGVLSATLNNGYRPSASNSFALVNYGSESGLFSSLSLPLPSQIVWQTNYGPTAFTVIVAATGPLIMPSLVATGTSNQPAAFSLEFTGNLNSNYSVLASTSLAVPLSNWTNLGNALLISNNQFQFIDTNSTNFQSRFYMLRSP